MALTDPLTDRRIKSLKPKTKVWAERDPLTHGLEIRIFPSGTKTWAFRYGQRRLPLGTFPGVPLKEARKKARDAFHVIENDGDPFVAKAARRDADTVAEFAQTFIEQYAIGPGGKEKPRKRSWRGDQRMLDHKVLPSWRHRKMLDITRRDVRELLAGVKAPIVGNRVRALLSKFFRYAMAQDVVEINPVEGTERPGREQQRDRVLSADDLRAFWTTCETLAAPMKAAWELRLLTAQRGGEIFGMRWQDVNITDGWWTVPSVSSKNKLPHRVPLSPPAIRLLQGLNVSEAGYIFSGFRGKKQRAVDFPIDDFRGHDLRRTAASLMAGGGVPRLTIAKILNHVETSVTAVYDRHSYDAEKQAALAWWAIKLDSILQDEPSRVLPFAQRG